MRCFEVEPAAGRTGTFAAVVVAFLVAAAAELESSEDERFAAPSSDSSNVCVREKDAWIRIRAHTCTQT